MAYVNYGGAAFPRTARNEDDSNDGMTLRDYYAGQVLAGIMSRAEGTVGYRLDPEAMSKHCFEIAERER